MVDILDDKTEMENFLRMEKWIFDSPDQAGEAFRQFIKDFYQGNKLVNGGLTIGDKSVSSEEDHDAGAEHLRRAGSFSFPPSASRPLQGLIGTKDYTQLAFKRAGTSASAFRPRPARSTERNPRLACAAADRSRRRTRIAGRAARLRPSVSR